MMVRDRNLEWQSAEIRSDKLVPPRSASTSVVRNAILSRVFGKEPTRIVVLQAPAGHGKSTTLQQIKSRCESAGSVTGWLGFDDADNDAQRFSAHLLELLESIEIQAGVDSGATVPQKVGGLGSLAEHLVARLGGVSCQVSLFFDDFQWLVNAVILKFWRELLARTPPNVRIFIGTRVIPEIGLVRMVINNDATILRTDDLRFSPAEVDEFLRLASPELFSSDAVETIYLRTEGWPAAVQLFRLNFMNSGEAAIPDISGYQPRELAEYLSESVLAQQSEEMRDFLMRTSLLSRLTAPLCDVVTGRSDSQEILLGLERSGLFLRSLDPDYQWFCYHALFAGFLRDQLRMRWPHLVDEVHRKAACWHNQQGNHEDAIHHAVSCRNYSLAADVLNEWSSRLIMKTHLMTVDRWYERIPFEEVAKRPSLAIKSAWAKVFLTKRRDFRKIIDLLDALPKSGNVLNTTSPEIIRAIAAMCKDDIKGAFEGIEKVSIADVDADVAGFPAFELAAAANMHVYRSAITGDLEGAHDHLILARAYNRLGAASFSGGYTATFSGILDFFLGRTEEGLGELLDGLNEQRVRLDKSIVSAALAACGAYILIEKDDLDAASALLDEYEETIPLSPVPDFLFIGFIARARLLRARQHADAALEVLDEGECVAHANGWPRIAQLFNWERVRTSLVDGNVDRALHLMEKAERQPGGMPGSWLSFSDDIGGAVFARIQHAIATGDAVGALEEAETEAERHPQRIYRSVKLLLLKLAAQYRLGEKPAARRSLREALLLGAGRGYVRTFLEGGSEVALMLREYVEARDGEHLPAEEAAILAFAEGLSRQMDVAVAELPTDIAAVQEEELLPFDLTERERELLACLAEGISNRVIGRRLFLSENTVKFHLKNIYAKMGVENRTQAVAMGRQHGLIV